MLYYNGKYVLQKPHVYRHSFRGSDRLFRACWTQYRRYLVGSIDDPTCDDDVAGWLDSIASEKVNNSKSVFYLRG